MTYPESLDYLNSFINHEKSQSFADCEFSLEPMKKLVGLLKLDLDKLKIIHIAGTKGKGSTAYMLSSTLSRSGYKVGLFSSPHIVDIRERIKIKNQEETMISEKDFSRSLSLIKEVLDESHLSPSYFEILTALAFIFYIEEDVDVLVLETGLGGRLDATNVVDPILSIITSIALEHTEILGDTLCKIAGEKAGIIKRNCPVVIGDMPAEASGEILKIAQSRSAKTILYGRDFTIDNLNLLGLSTTFKSEVQAKNAALVVQATRVLSKDFLIADNILNEALKNVTILGRYTQMEYEGIKLIADIAHTAESIEDLKITIDRTEKESDLIYILGLNRDKNFKSVLDVLKGEQIIFTSSNNPRALLKSDLAEADLGLFAKCTNNIGEALLGLDCKHKNKTCLVVTGSAYLVADLINYLNSGEKNAK